jgi:hypothetical protein
MTSAPAVTHGAALTRHGPPRWRRSCAPGTCTQSARQHAAGRNDRQRACAERRVPVDSGRRAQRALPIRGIHHSRGVAQPVWSGDLRHKARRAASPQATNPSATAPAAPQTRTRNTRGVFAQLTHVYACAGEHAASGAQRAPKRRARCATHLRNADNCAQTRQVRAQRDIVLRGIPQAGQDDDGRLRRGCGCAQARRRSRRSARSGVGRGAAQRDCPGCRHGNGPRKGGTNVRRCARLQGLKSAFSLCFPLSEGSRGKGGCS